jgi:hypothetical protein
MGIGTLRRYYRHKVVANNAAGDVGVAMAFQAKLEATAGTPLLETFPHRQLLIDRGYTMVEDLHSATIEELMDVGLKKTQAQAVLKALEQG